MSDNEQMGKPHYIMLSMNYFDELQLEGNSDRRAKLFVRDMQHMIANGDEATERGLFTPVSPVDHRIAAVQRQYHAMPTGRGVARCSAIVIYIAIYIEIVYCKYIFRRALVLKITLHHTCERSPRRAARQPLFAPLSPARSRNLQLSLRSRLTSDSASRVYLALYQTPPSPLSLVSLTLSISPSSPPASFWFK